MAFTTLIRLSKYRHGSCGVFAVVKDVLKSYISGRHLPSEERLGIVSFTVPDYGILFRSLAEGARTDLEMIAMFSLLRFVSHNKDIFSGRELIICTDYQLLTYLIDAGRGADAKLGAFRKEAKRLAGDIPFRVTAIAECENRATSPASDIPVLPPDADLKIKVFSSLNIKKPLNAFSIGAGGKSG
jgi:hypothetical protein